MARSKKEKAIMAEILSRAIKDDDYRKKFIADPKSILQEAGLEVDPDIEVKVVENSEKVRHVVIPYVAAGELSDEALGEIAGGDVEAQTTNTTTTAEVEVEVAEAAAQVSTEAQDVETTTTVVAECEAVLI